MTKSILVMLLGVLSALMARHAPGLPQERQGFRITGAFVDNEPYKGAVKLRRGYYTRFSLHLAGFEETEGLVKGETRMWILGPQAVQPPPSDFESELRGGECVVNRSVNIPYLDAEYRVIFSVYDSHGHRETRSFIVHP